MTQNFHLNDALEKIFQCDQMDIAICLLAKKQKC